MEPRIVAGEVVESARALEAGPGFPAAYVERARAVAGALTPFEPSDDDVVAATRLLQMQAGSDAAVRITPASWPRRSGRRLVKRLVDWYLNFLGQRVGEIAPAAARNATAVADRLDRIEGRQVASRDRLRTEVAALQARVAALEDQLGAGPPGRAAGSLPSR